MTWLIVRAGAGPHLFNLGDRADVERLTFAARVLLDFPPGHGWANQADAAAWIPNQLGDVPRGRELVPALDISFDNTRGRPHNELFQVGTEHDVAELDAVPAAAVAAYAEAHTLTARADHMAAYRQALADLPPDMLAELLAEHRHLLESP